MIDRQEILAFQVASAAHAQQVDKGGAPYMLHPLRVRAGLRSDPLADDAPVLNAIALLHDTVEDTAVTLDMLVGFGFNSRIIEGVDAISRRGSGPNAEETHREYIERCCKNDLARIVKRADLEDNMRADRPGPYIPPSGMVKRYIKADYYVTQGSWPDNAYVDSTMPLWNRRWAAKAAALADEFGYDSLSRHGKAAFRRRNEI